MSGFFRSARRSLTSQNSLNRYILYAIGEILLVVIGILIALSINNWQQGKQNDELEERYLLNLSEELRKDSVALNRIYTMLDHQARTKNPFLDILKSGADHDSLLTYFNLQWRPIYPYTPLRSTYEEMTNSSHLSIIRSDVLREAIVKMYNSYEDLQQDEAFLLDYFKNLVNVLSREVPDIYEPEKSAILNLGKDPYVMNSIRLNGAYTRMGNYREKLEECSLLLAGIRKYRASLD